MLLGFQRLLRAFSVMACTVVAAGSLAACASSSGDPEAAQGDEGFSDQNFTGNACEKTREALLGAAPSARVPMLKRAFKWIDADVPYNQSKFYTNAGETKAYRTDCSGFISMVWSLDSSLTTASFPAASRKLASLGDLVPGDALLHPKTSREPYSHIMLFAGWEDASHENMCVIQMLDTDNDMVMSPYNVALFGNTQVPIRKPSL